MARIVVADDDVDVRTLVVLKLESSGHQVVQVENGAQAVDRCRLERPDLVVLDLMMPVLDGYGVLERLKGGSMPIVVVSAKAEQADVDRAMDLGATEFVAKPFDLDRLVAIVQSTLPGG